MNRARGAAFAVGAGISAGFIAVAALALVWTPYDPGTLAIVDKLEPPSWHHWFGTDHLGRDVLSMVMAGAKNSVGVALLSYEWARMAAPTSRQQPTRGSRSSLTPTSFLAIRMTAPTVVMLSSRRSSARPSSSACSWMTRFRSG